MEIKKHLLTDNNIALGSAALLLGGAIIRLSNAIDANERTYIEEEISYSINMIRVYENSLGSASKDSLVTLRWRKVGDNYLKELHTTLRIAVSLRVAPLHSHGEPPKLFLVR